MSGRMKLLMKQIRREVEAGTELDVLLSRYLLTETEKAEIRAKLERAQEG